VNAGVIARQVAQVGERERGGGEDMCEKVRCPCWPASKGLSINAPTKALVKAGGARVRRDFRGYRARARAESGSRLAFILISNAGNGIYASSRRFKEEITAPLRPRRGALPSARGSRERESRLVLLITELRVRNVKATREGEGEGEGRAPGHRIY